MFAFLFFFLFCTIMKHLTSLLAVLGLATSLNLALSMAAQANNVEQLARDSGCLSCHSAKEKIVGPAFSAVAAKYKGESDAVPQLMQSVKNGSKGTWGRIPMPGHSSIADEDVKRLVTWVLTH
jgi:cytochrome c